MKMMKAEEYSQRQLEIEGWPLKLTSYRLGDAFFCQADNVSPGAWIARASGKTREQAEGKALADARRLLLRTRRQDAT
jgi:hypothetical protein